MKKTNDERLWANVRFGLLLAFASIVLLTILGKHIFHVPIVESQSMILYIKQSEQVLDEQKQTAQQLIGLQHGIDSLDFSIHQVQRVDEIKAEASLLQEPYRKHNNSSKYLFSLHAFRAVKGYFDIKEALSSTIRNNQIIENNLEECKANL